MLCYSSNAGPFGSSGSTVNYVYIKPISALLSDVLSNTLCVSWFPPAIKTMKKKKKDFPSAFFPYLDLRGSTLFSLARL